MGEAEEQGPCCSLNKLQASLGPRAPAESFIFLSALTPPPLINVCPGVFFSEAETAFLKTTLLIGGRMLGGTRTSKANVYTVPLLNPSSQQHSQDPWGPVSLNVVNIGYLPCPYQQPPLSMPTAFIFYTVSMVSSSL